MRSIVIGMGVQGNKRKLFAGKDFAGSVDTDAVKSDHRSIFDVPLQSYDAALCCTPDQPKKEILHYLLSHGKHVLVEKPLTTENDSDLLELEEIAREKKVVCYTAYNHRFEPHFVRMRELIQSGSLGKIYHCRMFYGNGTARLVRQSAWRDNGAGVLPDLGSHLLDTCIDWFGKRATEDFSLIAANRFENKAPDHVIIGSKAGLPAIELEMTLLMWRNHFTCDILAEKGTAHIQSLCKWGPSTFTHRQRVLPSGRPTEETTTIVAEDPTWVKEYEHFKHLIDQKKATDLSTDRWLQTTLGRLGGEIQ